MGLYEVRFLGQRAVAPHITEVTFSRPEGFTFSAGQYVQLGIPRLSQADHRGRSRVFSLISAVDAIDLTVAFRQSASGFKSTLAASQPGSRLRLDGPHGHTTFQPGLTVPLVLVAGGVGITAFLSMLRLARDAGHRHPIDVIAVNRSPAAAPYQSDVRELTAARSFGVVDVDRRSLPDALRAAARRHGDESLWFVSGPPEMVAETQYILGHGLRIAEHRIHGDAFVGYD